MTDSKPKTLIEEAKCRTAYAEYHHLRGDGYSAEQIAIISKIMLVFSGR